MTKKQPENRAREPKKRARASTVEMVAISTLRPYAGNARRHSAEQVERLAAVIGRLGFRFPVVLGADNVVIAGHGRLLAAKKLGLLEVPCIRHLDLDAAEERALRLADNRMADLAEDDPLALASELEVLAGEFSADFLGFDRPVDVVDVAKVDVVDVSTVFDQFWISVRGPLAGQAEALALVRAQLGSLPGVQVEVGVSEE